jgi:copper homeostasis protein
VSQCSIPTFNRLPAFEMEIRDSMSNHVVVEICVGDLESALQAAFGGADRVELCANLSAGGTTPSAGVIAEACRRLSIPIHVLVRPRAGDFLPSPAELAAMRLDIETAKNLGAAGVVFGMIRPDGTIDRDQTAKLADLARPLSVTFHKAFDQTRDPEEALVTLITLGVDRVLTSGCRPTAQEGTDTLKRLVEHSRRRIAIMAGGQLTAENVGPLISKTGVREIHLGSAVTRTTPSAMTYCPGDGLALNWPRVDSQLVRHIVELVTLLSGSVKSQ